MVKHSFLSGTFWWKTVHEKRIVLMKHERIWNKNIVSLCLLVLLFVPLNNRSSLLDDLFYNNFL